MGAKGGVIYKEERWGSKLKKTLLPKDRPFLEPPKMDWLMKAVLANIDLRGSTMGSRKEFGEMVEFVNKHKIKPVISQTVRGLSNLDQINGLFDVMAAGSQFGKLVIEIDEETAKL
ncbi:hypothetical protein NLG97_g11007 [Lecanicillium saksenae]|uniref:Uncharacterized protein n=1 Tax=Lecanicillium saksenae TaxID=468837 RepID=A0ACC1QE07_9HYPO|nr:hypothetical protein NLG97_g11007 [Lecanicillium saksenae]